MNVRERGKLKARQLTTFLSVFGIVGTAGAGLYAWNQIQASSAAATSTGTSSSSGSASSGSTGSSTGTGSSGVLPGSGNPSHATSGGS